MTDAQLTALVRSASGEKDPDIVSAYLALAGQAILNRAYPFQRDTDSLTVPSRYRPLQAEIAVYLLNKRGAEGQTAHGENGINRTYETGGIPDSMLRSVVPYCAVFGGDADADTEAESD